MVFSGILKLLNQFSNLLNFQGLNYYMKYLLGIQVPTRLLYHEIHIILIQQYKSFLKANYLDHMNKLICARCFSYLYYSNYLNYMNNLCCMIKLIYIINLQSQLKYKNYLSYLNYMSYLNLSVDFDKFGYLNYLNLNYLHLYGLYVVCLYIINYKN